MNPIASAVADESLRSLLVLLGIVLALAIYIWIALALAAMFAKMGEDAWKGWVPVWNVATLLKWGGFSPWLAFLLLIPGVGLVAVVLMIVSAHRINPGFGYGSGMTALAAVLFVVWASVLGFGPARWLGARAAAWMPGGRPAPATAAPETEVDAPRVVAPAPPPAAVTPPPAGADPEAFAPSAPDLQRLPARPPYEAPRPIDSVPGASPRSEPATPMTRTPPRPGADEEFPELSGEVSAVVGSPVAGLPRPAISAVPAQLEHGAASAPEHAPEVEDDLDRTVVARRGARWELVPASGDPIPVRADVLLLGRRPGPDPAYPLAQLVPVPGPTVSKTHARLRRAGERWTITDLASTNGVTVRTPAGDVEAGAGCELDATFFLGDEEFTLRRR